MLSGRAWHMTGTTFAIVGALVCGLIAAWLWQQRVRQARGQRAIIGALGLTACWCAIVAEFGRNVLAAQALSTLANLAWIALIYHLFAYDGRDRSRSPIRPLVAAIATTISVQFGVVLVSAASSGGVTVMETATVLRVMSEIGALVLVHNLFAGASASARQWLRWPTSALALWFGWQLNLDALLWITGNSLSALGALDGLVAALVALLLAIGSTTAAVDLRIRPSRAATFSLLSLAVIVVYLAVILLVSRWFDWLGGQLPRFAQPTIVLAAALAMLMWLPSRRVRGWLRVKVLKHLFKHRYDYRAEWMRFNQTIGRTSDAMGDLTERAARALADITDSQGALMLLPGDGGNLELASRWQWDDLPVPSDAGSPEFIALVERSGAVVELDEIRRGNDRFGLLNTVPAWMTSDTRIWAAVPLLHFGRFAGLAVLARPPFARALDWEDFDLLKVVGSQLASYLAEQRGHDALVEAARFDEFNRRIAFVMHDIKNLASQLSLLARNAERHADNPEFRKDMLVTLTNSSAKLNALLARLGRYGTGGIAQRQPVDLTALAARIAKRHSIGHPVRLLRADTCRVLANEEGLEQALVHLVQNAIDASDATIPVYLDLVCDGLQSRLEIIDSGAGMSPQFVRDGLFRPFVSSKDGGFGIGAFEARELVRAMGGRLEVESRPGIGTRFAIILPLSTTAGFLEDAASRSPGTTVQNKVA